VGAGAVPVAGYVGAGDADWRALARLAQRARGTLPANRGLPALASWRDILTLLILAVALAAAGGFGFWLATLLVSQIERRKPVAESRPRSHVWTTPAVQEESDYQRSVRVRSCIRPLSAAVWPLALM
jgi:hypothetical protein